MLAIKKVALTRQVTQLSKRGYYFNALSEEAKNFPELDFPMNLGYNDNFGHYALQMTFGSKVKLFFRRSALETMFMNHYKDLLRAITNQNFDQLERLCEDNLT
jgi:hypothetical protein